MSALEIYAAIKGVLDSIRAERAERVDGFVLIADLASMEDLHPTNVRKDLRKRGYAILKIRQPSGQWADVLATADANRWLAERLDERRAPRPSANTRIGN